MSRSAALAFSRSNVLERALDTKYVVAVMHRPKMAVMMHGRKMGEDVSKLDDNLNATVAPKNERLVITT